MGKANEYSALLQLFSRSKPPYSREKSSNAGNAVETSPVGYYNEKAFIIVIRSIYLETEHVEFESLDQVMDTVGPNDCHLKAIEKAFGVACHISATGRHRVGERSRRGSQRRVRLPHSTKNAAHHPRANLHDGGPSHGARYR